MKQFNTYHFVLYIALLLGWQSYGVAQSASYGNTYVHQSGEAVVFGLHDFLDGGIGIYPGMIGTDRAGVRGYLGFSNVSIGWTRAADQHHVDGYVRQYGNSAFTFPIGDDGRYRPLAISGASLTEAAYFRGDPNTAITNNFFGETLPPLPEGGPFVRDNVTEEINTVSPHEYWDINGDKLTKVTLTWDAQSKISDLTNFDLTRLTIVGWDGKEWKLIDSRVDVIYLNNTQSQPSYTGGVSVLPRGSITTTTAIRPNDYLAYTFGSINTGSVGDFVWEDLNRNGIQDGGEPPIEGVMIELYRADKTYVATTTSDANGAYYFEGVMPGRYYIKVTRPEGYNITLAAQGANNLNSDINFLGVSIPFRVRANQPNFDVDVGFYRNCSIGDFVWADDGDGIQDADEPGIADVEIQLCDLSGRTLATTVSSATGSYMFTNIPPGRYKLKVIPPEGKDFAPYQSTPDRTKDNDVKSDGLTEVFELFSGDIRTDIDAGISIACKYDAELVIVNPACEQSDGKISVVVTGETGPYTYQWNTGAVTNTINNLDSGEYVVTITDQENCSRSLRATLIEEECELICADVQTAVILEGAYDYDAGEMRRKLNELGYLPGQKPSTFFGTFTEAGQPYNRVPWHYMGPEGLQYDSRVSNNVNIDKYPYEAVDWVLVSLRENINVEYETCTRAGLLMRDGTILFFDDDNCCKVNPRKKYHLVVEHRNHLIVMSQDPIPVTDKKIVHDFRYNQSYTRLFGKGQKVISQGLYMMYAGNGDQYLDEASPVDLNVGDITEWLKENGKHSSYYFMDFDLNGDANVQDKGLYLENIGIFTDVPKSEN